MRRLTALLLVFVLLFSSFTFAGVGGGGGDNDKVEDDGNTGATYNQEEGNADIVTDTSDGKLVAATTEQWAIVKIQGSYTLTKYSMIINDDKIHVGTFQDVEWIKGITSGTYKNSKEDIDNFITVASRSTKYDYTEEEIRNTGFKIRAQVLIHARPPGGTFAPRVIEDNYDWLTSKNGDGTGGKTWIANKVMDAANNLGGSNTEGWAEYTVPPQNKTNVIASYIKMAGIEDGKVIYETFRESELIDTEYNELTGEVIPEMTLDLEGSTALLNDVLVSPKEIANSPDKVIWDETLPRSDTYQIEPKAEDVAFYNFGRVSSDGRLVQEFEKEISKEISMAEQNLTDGEVRDQSNRNANNIGKVALWQKQGKVSTENALIARTTMNYNQIIGKEEYIPPKLLTDKQVEDVGKTALQISSNAVGYVVNGISKMLSPEKDGNFNDVLNPDDYKKDNVFDDVLDFDESEDLEISVERQITILEEDENGNKTGETIDVEVREIEKFIADKTKDIEGINESFPMYISEELNKLTTEEITISGLINVIKSIIFHVEKLDNFNKVPILETARTTTTIIDYEKSEEKLNSFFEKNLTPKQKEISKQIVESFVEFLNNLKDAKQAANDTEKTLDSILEKGSAINQDSFIKEKMSIASKVIKRVEKELVNEEITETEIDRKKANLKDAKEFLEIIEKDIKSNETPILKEVSLENNETNLSAIEKADIIEATQLLGPNSGKKLSTVHLRYLVIPQSYQMNIINWVDETGNITNTTTFASKAHMISLNNGNDGLVIDDIRESKPTEYGDVDLLDWYTGDTTNDGSIAAPNGVNNGTTIMDPVETFNLGDTIYVTWELKLPPAGLSSGDVPEWRLSKYEDSTNFIKNENLRMSLSDMHWGCHGNDLGNEGDYEGDYDIILPNKKKSISSNSPSNSSMKNVNESWFHSEVVGSNSSSRIYKSSSSGNGNATVTFDADLTVVKSDDFMQLKVADWVETETKKNELIQYTLYSDTKGRNYLGSNVENKKSDLEYMLENKVNYTDRWKTDGRSSYQKKKYVSDGMGGTKKNPSYVSHSSGHDNHNKILNPTYPKFLQPIEYVFERYIPQVNDTQIFNFSGISNETSGKTEISLQENTELTVYPEVPMLFEDVSGAESIVFVAGDLGRKIKPVTYHTMEYKLFADAETVGTSIATDFKAKNKASTLIGNKPVLHKGSGANTSFDIKRSSSNNDRGYLEVKTFALDISDNTVKNDWGNGSYDTSNINQDFLDKWTFTGEAKSSLEIERPNGAGGVAYTGPNKVQNVTLTRDYTNTVTHNLIVRGGELTHVNGTPINTIRTSDSELYEALEGMKLVGANKDQTVLKTFVHKAGKLLSENDFKNLAANARNGIDNLNMNEGWYSEDSTVLEVNEHITRYNVPKIMFADKIPMSVNGLETPINKNMFYSDMSRGYATLNLEIESADLGQGVGRVSSYFDITTRQNSAFNDVEALYGVPNVSVTDTMSGW